MKTLIQVNGKPLDVDTPCAKCGHIAAWHVVQNNDHVYCLIPCQHFSRCRCRKFEAKEETTV
jgi:hypothetical protein